VRGAVLEAEGEAGLAEHSVWKLLEHWAQVLEKAKPQYTHDVVVDRMSITDRINQIVDLLESGKGMVRFEDLLGADLPEAELRHKVVVSLLAVLELARLRVVRILQQAETGSFFLAQTEGANLSEARNLNVTSAKEGAHAESEANTAPMVDPGPAEAFVIEEPVAEPITEPIAEPIAASATDETPVVEEPVAPPATDETPTVETIAEHAEQETESIASNTAQHVPQEDVISAPFPASAARGEEVIDGQTHEEQKTPQE